MKIQLPVELGGLYAFRLAFLGWVSKGSSLAVEVCRSISETAALDRLMSSLQELG
jgi:hypothetical protein